MLNLHEPPDARRLKGTRDCRPILLASQEDIPCIPPGAYTQELSEPNKCDERSCAPDALHQAETADHRPGAARLHDVAAHVAATPRTAYTTAESGSLKGRGVGSGRRRSGTDDGTADASDLRQPDTELN